MEQDDRSNRFYASRTPPINQQGNIYPQAQRQHFTYDDQPSSNGSYIEDESDLPSDRDSAMNDPSPPIQQDTRHSVGQNHRQSAGPTSFGERARTRPELALDISDDYPEAHFGNRHNIASPSRPRRAGSVQDRSPLQKLETTLGDISKEEKRARVERAEQVAAQRQSQQSDHGSSISQMRGTPVHRKPVPQADHLPERFETLVKDQHKRERSASLASPTSPIQSNGKYGNLNSPGPRDVQSAKPALGRTPSGRTVYDAARTGPAAAAAVDAIQASRWRRQTPSYQQGNQYTNGSSPTGPAVDRLNNRINTNPVQQYHEPQQRIPSQPSQSGVQSPQPYAHQPDISTLTQHQGQNSQHESRLPKKTDLDDKGQPGRDPVAPDDVRLTGNAGPQFSIPPQTLEGQRARERVGFGNVDPNQHAQHHDQKHGQEKQPHRRLHFSDILHINNRAERRYVGTDGSDEWKTAKVGRLTAEDLNLEGNRGSTTRLDWDQSQNQHDQMNGHAEFSPALSLKCGPLLRFTGIQSMSESDPTRRFWRGSAMIVTHDHESDYDTAPVMRIFKQPAELLPPKQAVQPDEDDESDPLVGHVKLGRKGEALYVRALHQLPSETDLSRVEDDSGLFEKSSYSGNDKDVAKRISKIDGEKLQQYRDVKAHRLLSERGVTFWRFLMEIELSDEQQRIAYRINGGPALAFWVPSKHQTMNMMFHSCNGFSHDIKTDELCGPDPLWRDVLSKHQSNPFHCMIGGGDQVYMDCAMTDTKIFKKWIQVRTEHEKHSASFSAEMQDELEQFYLDRYSMWFSTGLFGMATGLIPMVNMWDDHDIIDGFGSYPPNFNGCPVFCGVAAVAYKYYMLFQHQSVPDEDERTEPSWLLGEHPGPYINQLSRSLFMSLGDHTTFLGLDCRTERTRDEILSQETYDLAFDRCRRDIIEGHTRHLIVLLGVPIAYPRLVWLENVLTSKVMDPVKALGKFGLFGNFLNKFDGGVELLDDLDDHWTAKHHKRERNWFIQELQELAREKSVRITMLSGDVHLAAAAQFYSNPKLGLPKDRDHRYMPNVISSAIVNAPPPDTMADVLNKRNKVHHLDEETDEDMIPLFLTDIDGRSRNNKHMFPRRNWCSINEYNPANTRASTEEYDQPDRSRRSFSFGRNDSRDRDGSATRSRSITRRDPKRGNLPARASSQQRGPPSSYRQADSAPVDAWGSDPRQSQATTIRTNNSDATLQGDEYRGRKTDSLPVRPTGLTRRNSKNDKSGRDGFIEMKGGLEITIHCEVNRKDPAGRTVAYTLLVPALHHQDDTQPHHAGGMKGLLGGFRRSMSKNRNGYKERDPYHDAGDYENDDNSHQPHGIDGHQDDRRFDENARLQHQHQNNVRPSQHHEDDNDDVLYDADPIHTTASHQRASQDSDRHHSEKMIQRLPRSQAPLEDDPAFHRRRGSSSSRPGSRGRSSTAVGPPLPSNIDQLPLSVQRRYRQYNPAGDNEPQSANSLAAPQQLSNNAQSSNNNNPGFAPPSSYQSHDPSTMNRTRRYSGGSMESPILPIGQSYLRSSDKRTNLDPALYNNNQQGQAGYAPQHQQQQQLMNQDRRVASGPVSYSGAPQQSNPQQQHTSRDPYAKFLESPDLSSQPPATGNQSKIHRHYGVGNNDGTPSGGTYDPHYIPPQPQSPISHDWAQQSNQRHRRTLSDDTDRSDMTSPLPPARPLPAQLRNGQVVPEKVARHFDDMSPVQGQHQGQDRDAVATKPRRSSFSRMIRRLSGTEGKSVWRTEAERQERRERERSSSRAREGQYGDDDQGRSNDAAEDENRGREHNAQPHQPRKLQKQQQQQQPSQQQLYEQRQQQHLKQQQQPRDEDQDDGHEDDDGGAGKERKRRFKLFG